MDRTDIIKKINDMRLGYVGADVVSELECLDVEPTNRLISNSVDTNDVEYVASIHLSGADDECTVEVYYIVSRDWINTVMEGQQEWDWDWEEIVNWGSVIDRYNIV